MEENDLTKVFLHFKSILRERRIAVNFLNLMIKYVFYHKSSNLYYFKGDYPDDFRKFWLSKALREFRSSEFLTEQPSESNLLLEAYLFRLKSKKSSDAGNEMCFLDTMGLQLFSDFYLVEYGTENLESQLKSYNRDWQLSNIINSQTN